jgi:tetratricopeptide (TPR) repeat protein
MHSKKNLLTSIALLGLIAVFAPTASSAAGTLDIQKKLFRAYLDGDMAEWPHLMRRLRKRYRNNPRQQTLYQLCLAQYGYIGYNLGQDKKGLVRRYIPKLQDNLRKYFNRHPRSASAHALKGALYGFRIALAKYKAPFLGPKSLRFIKKAIALDRSNPSGWIELANAKLHTPPVFGGSTDKAIRYYQKALVLMRRRGLDQYNWLYLNTKIMLGRSYRKQGKYQKAKDIFQGLLARYPNFDWIKNRLLPRLQKRMAHK